MKNFLFWFAEAERRQAETHLIILDSFQKKLEFQPKGTAKLYFQKNRKKLPVSLRSAANLYGIFGEKEMFLLRRAKEIFSL